MFKFFKKRNRQTDDAIIVEDENKNDVIIKGENTAIKDIARTGRFPKIKRRKADNDE